MDMTPSIRESWFVSKSFNLDLGVRVGIKSGQINDSHHP